MPSRAMRSMFGVLVAHQAAQVGADVRDADVVAEDDQDIRLASGRRGRLLRLRELHRLYCGRGGERRAAEQHAAAIECVIC